MGRSVTVKDIAQGAEVSIATVSRVLNNHGNINEQLRQRVLQVAAELGYFKTTGQNSVSRDGKVVLKEIGFLLAYSDFDESKLDTFWAHILHGAEIEARKANIYVTYRGIRRNQTPYLVLSTLHEMRVDGILLVGPAEPETVRSIQTTNVPLVLVDNYVRIPGQQVDAVLSDNFEGTKEAIAYLIHEGHQHIAFLSGSTTISPTPPYTFERRKDGYLSAMRDAGLGVYDELMESCNVGNPDDVYAACKRLLDSGTPFSALFCANDLSASWAIKALRELGRKVPKDVSVVGFDDGDIAEHLTPPLTTMRVNKEAMGATAVKSLLARVADPQAVNVTSILGVELIKRESVRSLRE